MLPITVLCAAVRDHYLQMMYCKADIPDKPTKSRTIKQHGHKVTTLSKPIECHLPMANSFDCCHCCCYLNTDHSCDGDDSTSSPCAFAKNFCCTWTCRGDSVDGFSTSQNCSAVLNCSVVLNCISAVSCTADCSDGNCSLFCSDSIARKRFWKVVGNIDVITGSEYSEVQNIYYIESLTVI